MPFDLMLLPDIFAPIKNALAVGETAGRFDYHKSMELTGLRYRFKQQRATSTVRNHIPSFGKSK